MVKYNQVSKDAEMRGWKFWSGRRDSNSRLSAWEADILPLNYSRVSARLYDKNHSKCKLVQRTAFSKRVGAAHQLNSCTQSSSGEAWNPVRSCELYLYCLIMLKSIAFRTQYNRPASFSMSSRSPRPRYKLSPTSRRQTAYIN